MIQKQLRSYEVSVWSLQDDFISVLKSADIEHKGQVQEPELKLSVDGTQEFSFSIPMYLHNGKELVENPTWYDYKNGVIITNARKIKVIINKATEDEEIFEFLITKVTEKHDKAELYCEVECEGLAFQELGKTGYKISLKSDDFYNDDLEWFENGADETTRPRATLQYWCDKFLDSYPSDTVLIDPHIWYYTIEMDWSSYTQLANDGSIQKRDSDKVYEDEYVSSWQPDSNDEYLVPKASECYKEKERLVDFEESNKYNLTQDLAETFEVYCKYVYEHDEHYHIIGRKIVFYNSFIEEGKGPIDITYKYNATSISREMDSTELITKMFVRPVDSDVNDSGLITIMDVEANKSREDYLLNFDYLYKINAIDEDLYNAVPKYEKKMHDFNIRLIEMSNKLIDINTKIPELEAKLTMAKNAAQLDQERITSANDLLNNLIKKSGSNDGVLSITADNPDTAVLMQENSSADNNIYYINITKEGVIESSLHIYKTFNASAIGQNRLTDEIALENCTCSPDEFKNVTKITNLHLNANDKRIVYLTYDYKPQLYYDNIKRTWEARLMNDQKDAENAEEELTKLKNQLEELQSVYDELLLDKQKEVKYFEQLMGPALREGYWQPDDYTDYGDNYVESHHITMQNLTEDGNKNSFFYWDNKVFDEEQTLYYELGVNKTKTYYPCIALESSNLESIKNHLDELSFLYYDYDAPTAATEDNEDSNSTVARTPNMRRAMALGSEAQLAFIMIDNVVKPVILLTGVEKMTDDAIKYMLSSKSSPALGKLETSFDYDDDQNPIKVTETIYVNSIIWLTLDDSSKIVFPRIRIDSSSLKTSEDQLRVLFNDELLKNYSDFYLLTRFDEASQENMESKTRYYLTIRPETFISKWKNIGNFIKIKFTISNASTSIYLDAMQVLKDSSIPQVSYDLDIGLVQEQYVKTVYKMLNRIVNINDNELHFENVQGYVSEVTLDLDAPLEDKIQIKNYKTKFEDLFSKIVASTEQMKKTEYTSTIVAKAFSSDGAINAATLTNSLAGAKVNYSFNGGQLTMSENDGIWAISDSGIVSLRSDGIFSASEQDPNGNWLWKSCILPQGINADLIVAGQLDTSKIRILSGDKMRFQWNGDGLFAYKDDDTDSSTSDGKQYVVMNEDGLFLRAEKGAFGLDKNNQDYPATDVDRVAITWDGLTLRNYNNEKTLYMDPTTGDLKIQGNLYLKSDGFGKGGIYLGEEGFSISDVFKISRNITTNKLDYLSIEDSTGSNESPKPETISQANEDNYLFKLQREQNVVYEEGTSTPKYMSSYSLKLKNIILDDSLIQGIVSVVPTSVYKTSKAGVDTNNNNSLIPELPSDATNGSIGVFYTDVIGASDEPESQDYIFNASYDTNALETEGLAVGPYNKFNKDKRNTKTYCGIYATRWNVTSNAGTADKDREHKADWDANFSDYSRAGLAQTSTNKSATLSPLIINAAAITGTSFALDFSYKAWNGSEYDKIVSDDSRNPILIKIFRGSLTGSVELVASGTFTMPLLKHTNKSIQVASVQMTLTKDLFQNDKCWVIFYSTLVNSLIYINPSTVKIGIENTQKPTADTHALYVKSSGAWRKIEGSENTTGYILPTASTDTKGGIKVGDGLNINSDGKLNVVMSDNANSSTEPWSGKKTAESMEDIMLAVWHDYINIERARGDSSNGKGNGTTNGNGRTIHFYTSNNGLGFTEINKDVYPINRTDYENAGMQNIGACSICYWKGKFILTTSGRWRNSNGEIDSTYDGMIGVSEDLKIWNWIPFSTGLNALHTGSHNYNDISSVSLKCSVIKHIDNENNEEEQLWCAVTIKTPMNNKYDLTAQEESEIINPNDDAATKKAARSAAMKKYWIQNTVNNNEYEIQRSFYAQIEDININTETVTFWSKGMIPLFNGIIDETSVAFFSNSGKPDETIETTDAEGAEDYIYYNHIATIDPVLFEYNNQIMLLIKNESNLCIELYSLYKDESCTENGTLEDTAHQYWKRLNDNVFWTGTEAPTIAYFGGKWHIYADNYSSAIMGPRGIYHCSTTDFFAFSDYHRIDAKTNYSIHHGGIMTVSSAAAKAILRGIPDYATGGVAFIPKNQAFMLKRIESRTTSNNILTIKNLEVVPDTDYYISAPENGDIGYNTIFIENLINNAGVDHVRFIWNTTAVALSIKNSKYERKLVEEAIGVGDLTLNFLDMPKALNGGGRYVRDFDVFLPRDITTYMLNAGINGSKLDMRLRPQITVGDYSSNSSENAASTQNEVIRKIVNNIPSSYPEGEEKNLYDLGVITSANIWYLVIHTISTTQTDTTSVYTIRTDIVDGVISWSSLTSIYTSDNHPRSPRLSTSGVLTTKSYSGVVNMRIMAIPMIGSSNFNTNEVNIINDTLTKEIRALSEASSFKDDTTFKRCFTIGAISDLHDSTGAWKNFTAAINRNKSYIDLALCLGDTVQRPKNATTGAAIANFAVRANIDPAVAYMQIIGNHDVGYVDSGCINVNTLYSKYITQLTGIIVDNNHPYYYKDFSNYKIRMICLFEYEAADDTTSTNPVNWRWHRYMSKNQLDWFVRTLKNTPDGYGVIVALHQPVWENNIIDETSPFTATKWYSIEQKAYPPKPSHNIIGGNFYDVPDDVYYNYNNTINESSGNYIGDIVHAFINKKKFCKKYTMKTEANRDLEDVIIKVDFTSSAFKAKQVDFICYIGGHTHASFIMRLADYPEQLQIIVPSGSNAVGQRRWDDLRPDGSDNYYYIAINRDRKVIKLLKAGSRITNDCRERKITEISYDTTNGGT